MQPAKWLFMFWTPRRAIFMITVIAYYLYTTFGIFVQQEHEGEVPAILCVTI